MNLPFPDRVQVGMLLGLSVGVIERMLFIKGLGNSKDRFVRFQVLSTQMSIMEKLLSWGVMGSWIACLIFLKFGIQFESQILMME